MRMMKFWESVMEQAKKTKKYAITLKSGKQAIKKVKVSLKKVNGKYLKGKVLKIKFNKKTYKVKTNKKGVATFKITKLTKKGKYIATIKYKGSKYYKKLTKKAKITIK